jgi:hypothetical protein
LDQEASRHKIPSKENLQHSGPNAVVDESTVGSIYRYKKPSISNEEATQEEDILGDSSDELVHLKDGNY